MQRTAGFAELDPLGNPIDPAVQYARGRILRNSEDETLRMQHGFDMISAWVRKKGASGLYNLNGIIRYHPLKVEDLSKLDFFNGIAYLRGKAEEVGVRFLGGDPSRHDGLITNRVSAATIAAMLALVRKGDAVICPSPDGRGHPSLSLGIKLAGGIAVPCRGYSGFETALESNRSARTVAITTISPQLRNLPFDEVKEIVAAARSKGMNVFVDDAHAALRMVAFKEPGIMKLEPDAAAISSDKHVFGPRAGVMAGQREHLGKIRTIALELGYEAQTPILAGVYRALKTHKIGHILKSLKVAEHLHRTAEKQYPNRFYKIGDCVAMTDEAVIRVLEERMEKKTRLVPQEASSAMSMLMLKKYAIVTVANMAAPGAGPYLRLIMWPDGARLSAPKVFEAIDYAVNGVAKIADDDAAVRKVIMGP